jgi:lambda family phage portal protein
MNFFSWIGRLFKPAALPADTRVLVRASSNSLVDMGDGGGGGKWPAGLSRSGTAPILNHNLLRLNARSAYHTSLEARGIVERHTDSVVDTGLRLNSIPDADILGISPEEAERWAAQVEAAFDRWAQSRTALRSENMSFYQAQRLAGICQQRDGEYFIRLYYSPRRDLLNPLQIAFIDPAQIRGSGYTNTGNISVPIGDGIDRDEDGRETSYDIWALRDGTYQSTKIPAVAARSGRTLMIHGYQPEYPGQTRGYSRLAHALQEFENITDFKQSEIKKAIAQSSLFAFVKPSPDNPASNPFEAISHAGPVGTAALSEQAQELTAGTGISSEDVVDYVALPEATIKTPGSVGVFNLSEGEELKPFTNSAPVASFNDFITSLASHLSASLSIPLEVVLMRFNQNYSASRAALILFWRIAMIWREEMASDFLNVVYENWLAGEIASGRISAPGWSDPRLRGAWLKNQWIGAPMPNIDPSKSAAADRLYVEMGAQTLDRVAMNFNGSSGKSNRAKLAREYAELPGAPWNDKQASAPIRQNANEDRDNE